MFSHWHADIRHVSKNQTDLWKFVSISHENRTQSFVPSPKTKLLTTPKIKRVIFSSSCLFFLCWFVYWCESTYNYGESKSEASSWVLRSSIHSCCRKYQRLYMCSVHLSIFRFMQSHFLHFNQWSLKKDKLPQ